MSDATRALFYNYFDEGLTPSAAKNLHEMKLLSSNAKQDIAYQLADSQINPRDREITYLFDDWRYFEN